MANEETTSERTGSAAEYTIDELAAASRVPSRTIRFYQSNGALPRPQIRGRVAYYGPEHIERLKLIASLQDRGLRIRAIRDLVGRIDHGELALGEWLGLEGEMQAAWTADEPRVLTETEIHDLSGERRAGTIGELARLGLVRREGGSYVVESPGLLRVALDLRGAGVSLDTTVGAIDLLRKHLRRAARDLGDYVVEHAGEGFGVDPSGDDLGSALAALRPLGLDALRLVFGREMQRVLRDMVVSGEMAKLRRKKKKK